MKHNILSLAKQNAYTLRVFVCCFLICLIPSISEAKDKKKEKPEETRPMLYYGHYVGAAFSIGPRGCMGYENGHHIENPWVKGDPNFYLGWKINYYWLPRHEKRKSPSFGVGLQYAWGRSHGKDRIVKDYFLYDSSQAITVNYLAPQCVMKVLTQFDGWTFNVRAGMGLGRSHFSGHMQRVVQGDNYTPISRTKYSFGFNIDFGIEAKVSSRFSVTADLSFVSIFAKGLMHDPALPGYDKIKGSEVGTPPFSIGLCYHL